MNPPLTPALRERAENTIRFLAADAVQRANSGHPGAPMGLARPVFQLWDAHLRFDPDDPAWPLRDRFVLSNGHSSMLLYALLTSSSDLAIDDSCVPPARLTSRHPVRPHPGVETTTGPRQGFATGVGMALAARLARARFARDGEGPGHHLVYGIVSDGDLMEGVSAEAGSIAGHLGLGNLIYLYDDNHITIDGPTDLSFTEDVAARFGAQKWHVQRVADGNDHAALSRAIDAARAETERPSLILMRTTIGYGSPHLAGKSKTHGAPLGADEVRATKEALGWPQEPTFFVPDDVRAWFASCIEAKRAERKSRDAKLAAWRKTNRRRRLLGRAPRTPHRRGSRSSSRGLGDKKAATRVHSGEVIQRATAALPFLIGGYADLAESNNTIVKGAANVGPGAGAGADPFAGRNLHFGIREHGMGSIANGLSLDGTFLPYVATFLVFSDYMRPAIRLASLMGLRVVYVFTHDSIFLGEDGPTHQPIEHLDALRVRFRVSPCSARPTDSRRRWRGRTRSKRAGPVALALTRQALPPARATGGADPKAVWRGGYLARAKRKPTSCWWRPAPKCRSREAAEKLASQQVAARVVSMPSLELFAEQPDAYRHSPTARRRTPIVAVEMARGESLAHLGARGLVSASSASARRRLIGAGGRLAFTRRPRDRVPQHLPR
jgi:transketolase